MTDSPLEKAMEKLPTSTRLTFARFEGTGEKNEVGIEIPQQVTAIFSFTKKGVGFGEIAIVAGEDGQTYIDTEYMSKETVLEMFRTLLDEAILDSDQDPERHRKYDEVMRRRCAKCPQHPTPKDKGE